VGAFAGAALLLAALGLYGLLSAEVVRRNREFGIRLALGADADILVRSSVVSGLRLTAIGLAAGLAGSWYAGRWIESLLPSVPTADPMVRMAASGLLMAVAAFACWIPARRIRRVDPQAALRQD
jgi:ABC-type antimicrobial peptide transport system permease subunit